MEIITVILSSALVSGLVSVIVTYVFENKKYLKEKRFSTYTNFLDQLDKILPVEIMEDLKGDKLVKRIQTECAKIERYIWQIKLVTGNNTIQKSVDKIFDLIEELTELIELTKKEKEIMKVFTEIDREREILITEMNLDISRF